MRDGGEWQRGELGDGLLAEVQLHDVKVEAVDDGVGRGEVRRWDGRQRGEE